MEINLIEKENKNENDIKNNLTNENLLINEKEKNNFLETTLGKIINTAFDIGIRALLPDFVEEQIIDLKNNLIDYGLKEGINKTVQESISVGKSAIGLITGNYKDLNQMKDVVQVSGLIDGISDLVDLVVNKVQKEGLINLSTANTIKNGKNTILNSVERKIEEEFKKQFESIENANKNIDNWKIYFEKKDFEGMEKEYTKLKKQINNIAPIEKTINEARTIEILHNLIKNNGHNFNLTSDELELVEKLK